MKSLCVIPLLLMAGMRASPDMPSYVVEVYFIVDPQVIQNYEDLGYNHTTAISTISADLDYFILQINEMYQSLLIHHLDMQVRAKHIQIMKPGEAIFEECVLVNGTDLQIDMGLAKLREWLVGTKAKNRHGYDVTVALTGYDMFSTFGDNHVTGYSTTETICAEDAMSLVEFDGTINTALNVAHEIAHTMGVLHLTDDLPLECSPAEGYIMSAVTLPRDRNRWYFSVCSAHTMMSHLEKLTHKGTNCLLKTSTVAPIFQLSDAAGTDIMDPEKVCQRKFKDKNTYFCHYTDFYDPPKGDGVCQVLMCGKKGGSSCVGSVMPSDGMICDVNKRCEKGRCVPSYAATKDVDTDCVFGDIQSEYLEAEVGQSCEDLVNRDTSLCYAHWVQKERCCATCKTKLTGIPGCEYGDKSAQCKDFYPSQICGSSSSVCCQTCHDYVDKRSMDNDSSSDPTSIEATVHNDNDSSSVPTNIEATVHDNTNTSNPTVHNDTRGGSDVTTSRSHGLVKSCYVLVLLLLSLSLL